MVGYNRDETVFFFNQQRNTEVINLTEVALKERLAKEFAGNADAIFETYQKSRVVRQNSVGAPLEREQKDFRTLEPDHRQFVAWFASGGSELRRKRGGQRLTGL